jgi:hypothetical protein
MIITQFTLEGPEKEELSVEVSAEQYNEDTAEMRYVITGDAPFNAQIRFDCREQTMMMTGIEVPAAAYVACLGFCGLGSLAQEILDCWKQGARTPGELIRCLRAKGHSISKGLVSCAFGCIPSGFGGR